MDIAYVLAEYIADAGYGTLNIDVFAGQIPEQTNGIYVVRSGGTLDSYLPVEESVLDIYCRNTSASTCIETLEGIKRTLHRMHTTQGNGSFIFSMLMLGDVEDVERDLEYAKIYKVTVSVMHRDTDLIS